MSCIVSYPCDTPGMVELVSYDDHGRERESRRTKANRITERIVASMVSKLI